MHHASRFASLTFQWVEILEAATPDNPTVFAAPADHRIAPPLSYRELLDESSVTILPSTSASAGTSGGLSLHGGSGSNQRVGRAGGTSTDSRYGVPRERKQKRASLAKLATT